MNRRLTVAVCAVVILALLLPEPSFSQLRTTLIVQDFRNRSYDIRHDWVGVGLAYLVRKNLQSIGSMRLLEDRGAKENDPEPLADFIIEGEVRLDESAQEGAEKFVVFVTLDRTGESAVRRQFLTEGAPRQLFDMADYLAERIGRHLDAEAGDSIKVRFGRGMTRNFLAYQQFAEAMVERRIHVKLESYERAVVLDPSFAEAYFHIARVYTVLRNYAEAETRLQRVVELLPDAAEAHNDLGYVLAQQGKLEPAMERYRSAIQYDVNEPKYHLNLGDVLRHLGRTREAKVAYQGALRVQPQSTEAVSSLALLEGANEGGAIAVAAHTTPAPSARATPAPSARATPAPSAKPTAVAAATPVPSSTPVQVAQVRPSPASTASTPLPTPPKATPTPPPSEPSPVPVTPTPPPAETPKPVPKATPAPIALPIVPTDLLVAQTALSSKDQSELELAEKSLLRARGDRTAATGLIEQARKAAMAVDRAGLYLALGRFYVAQKANHAALDLLRESFATADTPASREELAAAYDRIGRRKEASSVRAGAMP